MIKRVPYRYGMDSREIHKIVEEGCQLTCPRCSADLEIALSKEQSLQMGIRRGVFCPNNGNHVGILFEFTDDHLAMRKLFTEMREERENRKVKINKSKF